MATHSRPTGFASDLQEGFAFDADGFRSTERDNGLLITEKPGTTINIPLDLRPEKTVDLVSTLALSS